MEFEKSNLNRSFSEPYFRKVVVKEHYQLQNSSNSLIRTFSYSEIYSSLPDLSVNSFCTSQEYTLGSKNCLNQLSHSTNQCAKSSLRKCIEASSSVLSENIPCVSQSHEYGNLRNCEEGTIEPEESLMEVDDIENDEYYNLEEQSTPHENNKTHFLSIKHKGRRARRLNNVATSPKEKCYKSKLNFFVIFFIFTAIVAWFCYKTYYFIPMQKKYEHIMKIYPSLNKILNQDHALGVTLENLHKFHERNNFKNILVYVGATGVGKTYIANLIKQNIPKEYVIDINFHLQIDANNLGIHLTSNDCYFVIVDNLKIDDLEAVITYINEFPDTCMLVLPIFNIHDVNDKLEYTINYNNFYSIRREFNRIFSSNIDIVLFNNINRATLEHWLMNQIEEEELTNYKQNILLVLNEHDVENYGFKGLMTKIVEVLSR